MKELTLKDLQKYSLQILIEVDRWCSDNQVTYTLCGGSLIGAVRHKGFIPWDDDVDIAMPRPDYEKFVRGFNKNGYICIAPELGNSWIPFARVCETTETVAVPYCPWCTVDDYGVGIDIFPWDGEPSDINEFRKHMSYIQKQHAILYQVRGSKMNLTFNSGILRFCKIFGKKVIYGHHNIEKLLNKIIDNCKKYKFEESTYCGNLSCPTYGTKERNRVCVFSSFTKTIFEGHEVSVISNYNEYLSDIFGDYMKLPPVKDRIPKHNEHKVYFK